MSNNEAKSKALGMPFGTASGRLRKRVLFEVLARHRENVCYRCGREIESSKELSIEHKNAWMAAPDPKKAFFDMSNIAFSHLVCNCQHGWRNRVTTEEGMSKCSVCGEIKPVQRFSPRNTRWNGVRHECKDCEN